MLSRKKLLLILRILLWLLPAICLTAAIVVDRYFSQKQDFAEANLALVGGDLHAAGSTYRRLAKSFWWGENAKAGMAIVRALTDSSFNEPGEIRPDALRSFPIDLLLFKAVEGRKFEACLRLADFQKLVLPTSRSDLFRILALLELERFGEADRIFMSLSAKDRDSWLGRRLGSVKNHLKESAATLIYDRLGLLIGRIDGEGSMHPGDGINLNLIPSPVIEDALKNGGKRGIRVSLDLDLTRIAYEALEGYRGSIVFLDPDSGEVLAAVSDERTLRTTGVPAFVQLREPASISKLITTTAAMRAGYDPDTEIAEMTCEGAKEYRGGILYCAYRAGPLQSLDRAMAVSCNIAFANLGVRIGEEALVNELRRYGFDRSSESGFRFGSILRRTRNDRDIADLSIGIEMSEMTPLHGALIAAIFATGGKQPEPFFLHAIDGFTGLSPIKIKQGPGKTVITPEMARVGKQSMLAVTGFGGTGYNLAPDGLSYAMKTGTASDGRTGYHTNYIGFFPASEPRVAFCVRVTHQRTSSRVRRATIDVMRKLLAGVHELSKSRRL